MSDTWSYRCYVALYAAASKADGEAGMAELGPCFWELEGAIDHADGTVSFPQNETEATRAAFRDKVIGDTCTALVVESDKRAHCDAELRYAINDMCQRGDPALSGAGP